MAPRSASAAPISFPPIASGMEDGDFAISSRDFELIASIAKAQAGIVIREHKSAMIRGRLMPDEHRDEVARVRETLQLGKPHFQEFLAAWQEQPG